MARSGAVLEGKDRYETIKHLGEGQFANVFQAKDLMTGEVVAIKKIKLGSRTETMDGINRTALREIKLLQEIQHDNIITLRDVFGRRTNIQLVFDFMETDLENLIRDTNIILTAGHIKNMCLQMLLGLEYLHLHWILHRDLKPNNLLMNANGRMKLADFGLARFFGSPNRAYTHQVPFFAGESDLDQLCKIYSVLGVPTDEEWPERKELHDYVLIKDCGKHELSAIFTAASPALIQLIGHCLKVNPNHRCTCAEALQSLYFQEAPFACDDSELPVGGDGGGVGKKKRRLDGGEGVGRRLDFHT
ncbi:Cell division protein kinase 7 [Aphelenchoides fujianensis]|nr:Cell division protein kinase 7 [Aphelenchoides fujianensis]KAI6223028.1 Cell division protein kinase 7 [Aphelenchoides fujianensis]